MRAGRAAVWGACAVILACQQAPATADGGAPPGGGVDAGDRQSQSPDDDPLEVFLRAARTNLAEPYPAKDRASDRLYFAASQRLPGAERRPPDPASILVPRVLGQSDDPRAREALVAWARSPEARPYLSFLLDGMSFRPDAAYLETVQAILANADLASELSQVWGNSFSLATGIGAQVSLYAQALDLAAGLPGEAGRALVQRIAADRSASAPDPRTLSAFRCPGGRRIEDEAQALASLRLMALSVLADRALWDRVARDPAEPALIRSWTARLSRGPVDRALPGWRARATFRDRHAEEEMKAGVRERDQMPCVREVPGTRGP